VRFGPIAAVAHAFGKPGRDPTGGDDMPQRALEGIRVIEFGEGVSAPFCAKLFGDYGADVVKVERANGGDLARRWGPFPDDEPDPEKSGLFFSLNTNKRGVTLDVDSSDGREELRSLIAGADVFIENQQPRQMRRWGLDYAALSAHNPDLVMISVTPFGQTGPYADWKGCDLNAFHLSAAGARYCGRPGEAPLKHGTFSADFFGAYVATTWGLAALRGREAASGGQHVDVSCAEALAAVFVGAQNIGLLAQDGIFETRSGVGLPMGAPATIIPCNDGYVWMVALEPGQWNGLCKAMGDPEWAQAEIFQDMFARAQNADVIYPLIKEWSTQHGKQEVMDLSQANGCPTTALFTVAEAADHPHLQERDYVKQLEHPAMGSVRVMGAPVRLPASPGGPETPAPLLGQHDAEVRGERAKAPARSPKPRAAAASVALPLADIRVANFGWGWLGPVAGQTLAFLGAEVYKIESHARVDINRTIPPFGGGVRDPDRSLQNHAAWAGNGSVTINLKKPEGQELARQLVSKCDVVIENFGPGVMDKLHLSYEDLRAVKPDIIMTSMPAAGLFGPLKDIRTYGMSLSSITGLDSLTGYRDGPPIPMENAFADPLGGVIGALASLLALHHRDRSGEGQHVDYSQQEGVMQTVAPAFMDYTLNGRVAGPMGNRHPLAAAAPHGVFPCAGDDRWVAIAVFDDEEWQGLVNVMGAPTWARASEYASAAGRVENIEPLEEKLSEWTRGCDSHELAERLQREGVAATPVLNVGDLLTDPHYRARKTFVEVEHPLGFRETIYDVYAKTSGARFDLRPGPVMGCDNDHVFKQLLEIPEDRYRQLVEAKVID
jgi:crotonobetainyl-CoA:carnitine CoA-transferase CaiB-like acyl-CoA transferase